MLHNESTVNTETRVFEALQATCPLTIDELLIQLPELRWNEVFHAIDLLSRTGQIVLRRHGFEYEVYLAAEVGSCA